MLSTAPATACHWLTNVAEAAAQNAGARRQAGGRLWTEIREVPLFRCVLAVISDELTNHRNKENNLTDQFVRISVEGAGYVMRFGRRRRLSFLAPAPNCGDEVDEIHKTDERREPSAYL